MVSVFFKPWIGKANRDFNGLNSRNILVIGASRYCTLRLNHKDKTNHECHKQALCRNAGTDYNNWCSIKEKCPLMKQLARNDDRDHILTYELDNINTWSVYTTGNDNEDQETAYNVFSNILNLALGQNICSVTNGMSRVNFCNFLQTILTESRDTPSYYTGNQQLYKNSLEIVDAIIEDIGPDGIIFWASTNCWEGFYQVCKLKDDHYLATYNSDHSNRYLYGESKIPLVSIPHPARFYDFNGPWTVDNFNEYEKKITRGTSTTIEDIAFLFNVERK